MKSKNIKPNKVEHLDSLPSNRTGPHKNSARVLLPSPKTMHPSYLLLKNMRNQFIQDVVNLGFNEELVFEVIDEGLPCLNVNMAIEMINEKLSTIKPIKS